MGTSSGWLQYLDGPPERAIASLAGAGFREPERALETLRALRAVAEGPSGRSIDPLLEPAFAKAADPDLALDRLHAALLGPHREAILAAWGSAPGGLERFVRVASVSRFAGEQLLRWPILDGSVDPPAPDDPGGIETMLVEAIRRPEASVPALADLCRAAKKLQVVRIAARDICDGASPQEVGARLSALADALIRAALELAAVDCARRFRLPEPVAQGFGVFALGKLGGAELNYSSDVDLLFVHGDLPAGIPRLEEIGRETYYTRLGERLLDALSRVTPEGPLWRVDMRLRPQGRSGQLVASREGILRYYESTAHVWERQALIRLRPIAGDAALLERLREALDPIVYRKYLSLAEIREIQRLKGQMEREARRRGSTRMHVKLGEGGIRDVEFTVQFLQLLNGARHPEIKGGNVFEAIGALRRVGALTDGEAEDLLGGYSFLRLVEHRLQLDEMLQTFEIPCDPAARDRLARGLGFPSPEPFLEELDHRTEKVRRTHRTLFGDLFAEAREDGSDVDLILELPTDDDRVREVLAPHGFRDPLAAYRRLRSLASPGGLGSPRARKFFANIAGRILSTFSRHPDPDACLARFEGCVATLGAPSVFYQLLSEDEPALRLFLDIAAHARLVVDILRGAPGIFDEVVDALLTGQPFDRFALTERLRQSIGQRGERAFHEFKRIQTVLIAIRDITERDNLANTMANLTALADAIVMNLTPFVGREVGEKLGRLRGDRGTPTFAVLGLGKLGGEELNYSSDLDLVCVFDGAGRTESGLEAQEYFIRYVQALIRELARQDYLGPLYPVDLRLRPMGSHDVVVASFDRLREYFASGEGAIWERQAFTRIRGIAGDKALARRIRDFFLKEVIGGLSRDQVFPAVLEMRGKLERASPAQSLKRGPGGLVDIEFLVQALQLTDARAHPDIATPNTPQGLVALGKAGLLSPAATADLLTAYQFLRWLEMHLSLFFPAGADEISFEAPETEALARRLGYSPSESGGAAATLASELAYHRERTRRIFNDVLGG
ncbi:MAG: hypothetical protein JXP34_10290 [Planctomycetes bacterium]|nr:hypothetical protein [Planctomycetota bacterium]